MEPTVEDAQRLMLSEQHSDDMVQFQAGPITNMIPNSDWQNEYQKKKSCMNWRYKNEKNKENETLIVKERIERESWSNWKKLEINLQNN